MIPIDNRVPSGLGDTHTLTIFLGVNEHIFPTSRNLAFHKRAQLSNKVLLQKRLKKQVKIDLLSNVDAVYMLINIALSMLDIEITRQSL